MTSFVADVIGNDYLCRCDDLDSLTWCYEVSGSDSRMPLLAENLPKFYGCFTNLND